MKAKDKVKQIFAPKKKEGGVVIMIGKPSKMKGKEMEDDEEDDKCEKCGKKGCKMKCGGKVKKYQEGGKVDNKKEKKPTGTFFSFPNGRVGRTTPMYKDDVNYESMDTTGYSKGKKDFELIESSPVGKTSKKIKREDVPKKIEEMKKGASKTVKYEKGGKVEKMKDKKEREPKVEIEIYKKGGKTSKMKCGGKVKK